ncbi:hypothetical protein EYB45_11060 [Erythrobacteraceae bacterium CFH 75059]|uniref:hypothetical protein n=1 Tax=Qipengyuania thermophila TaxID=2509361 RepID=UPI0010226204|nr:hypothetical protein [Qipengyuania thermophila]TCD00646.1 hypothetical protein EYB45_11060 [Erythrobacteraceae bacterium CFH 75059]
MTAQTAKRTGLAKSARRLGAGAVLLLAAGCAQRAAPPPAPVAPPPVTTQFVVPPRPLPPPGAPEGLVLPPRLADGVRQTVNTQITPSQTIWNLRSALNVAALNCVTPEYEPLVGNYQTFLTRFRTPLSTANRSITREFAERYGRAGRASEDAYITKVYNYFATPAVHDEFCASALALSAQAATVPPAELGAFAATALPTIEAIFEGFFNRYEQYQRDLSEWERAYGATVPVDPYELQQAVLAAQASPAVPQPLPTAGPVLR